MRYRLAYVTIGIIIMAADTIFAFKYQKFLIYSYWGSFLGFFIPFGVGLSILLYGIFKAKDYGINSIIDTLGSGGSIRVLRQNKITKIKVFKADRDILSDLPGAVKSPDGKTVEYRNLFIRKPYGTTKYTRKFNDAANKYINGELDEEGFYNYIGKHGPMEEQMFDFLKKFKNNYK